MGGIVMGYLTLYLKDLGGGVRAYRDSFYDDNGNDDAYVWSDTSVSGYVAVTDIHDFLHENVNGFNLGKADFLAKKDAAKKLVSELGNDDVDAGLDLITDDSYKIKLADMLIGSFTKRLTIYGGDMIKMQNKYYDESAKFCRMERFDTIIRNGHVTIPTDMINLLNLIENYISTDGKNLQTRFSEKGIKGQPYDDEATHGVGLSNLFKSIPPFIGTGFLDQTWTPITGETLQQVSDRWCDILFEGGVI
jgi:hypothetical protein